MGIVEDIQVFNVQTPLTVYVFYMGGWCDWCCCYAQDMEREFIRYVERHHGKVFFVTAESQELADMAREDWRCSAEFLSDQNCDLAHLFNIPIGDREDTPLVSKGSGADEAALEYPHGFIYPAILAFYKEQLVFKWTAKLDNNSLKGMKNRPLPSDLWEVIKTIIQGKSLDGMMMKAWGTENLKERNPEAYQKLEQHYKSTAPHLLPKFLDQNSAVPIPAAPCHVFEAAERFPHPAASRPRELPKKGSKGQGQNMQGHTHYAEIHN